MRLRRFLTPRVIAAVVGVIALFAVFGGTFRAPGSGLLPPPSVTTPTTAAATTTSIDHSGIALAAVEGTILDPPLVETGESVISGVVEGPDGRIPGATVRAERLVGDQVQRLDTVTAEDGTFRLGRIPGGRYRIRAWLAPTFTVVEPEVFYMADGDARELALRAEELDEMVVRASTRPEAPIVGNGVNLAISVADLVVDADGVAREQPRPGVPVSVSVSGWLEIDPGAVRVTDGSGVVAFEFSCERVGSVSATATVGGPDSGPDDPPSNGGDDGDSGDDGQPGDQPDPNGDQGNQGDQADQADLEVVPLDVPPCAPVPTTTTTTTTTPDSGDDGDGGGDGDDGGGDGGDGGGGGGDGGGDTTTSTTEG